MIVIETSKLQQMKQDLIKTKPPIESQVKKYYSQLVSQLHIITSQGISDDKFVVLFNDTLSICMLRLHALVIPFQEQNLIFDYILQFINHPFPPLQNSLQSLLSKLLIFEGSEIPNWIDKIMNQYSLTKNLYLLLETLLKKIQDKKYFYSHYPDYPEKSLLLFDDKVANSISKTLHVIYDGLYTDDPQKWYLVWRKVVGQGLSDPTKRSYVVTYLLPNLIKKDRRCLKLLINEYSNDLEILLCLLNMSQKLEVIEGLEKEIDLDILTNCLVSEDPQLRLNALQLVLGVDYKRLNNTLIPKSTFELIKINHIIEININDSDNQDKFLSVFYRFISGRFKNSLGKKNSTDSILMAQEFLSWLLNLLQEYLQTGSNFQQTMGSIIILGYITEKLKVDIFENLQLIKLLTKLLFSDFKAIRNSSLGLLNQCKPENFKVFLEKEEKDLLPYSFTLLSSLTGRVSEGGAKVLQCLSMYYSQNEKEKFEALIHKLVCAITTEKGYIHGHFTALNLIISGVDIPSSVCQELLENIILAWDKQKTILSLEVTGYDDDGDNGDEEDGDIDQNTIKRNYSWKLVKYSNELLITILEKYTDSIGNDRILQCSELIIDQLSSIKHKGAFTSIYPSFIRLCHICLSSDLKNSPRIWLDNNLKLIKYKTQLISRRSGGIPYLITGILIASKQDINTIDYAFTQLLQIANESYDEKLQTKEDLPQVHAYNTLKQIFIESTLANESIRFIQDSLLLCLANFASNNWSIRNCAVMLFASIKQRIFGNNDKYSAVLFFSRFPKLKNIILHYLTRFRNNEVNNQTIFPLMMILSQLDFKEKTAGEFTELLKPCLSEPAWKVRELAARALENLLSEKELCRFADGILANLPVELNTLHGFLLCLLYGTSKINYGMIIKLQSKIPDFIVQPFLIINALINTLKKLKVHLNQENLNLFKQLFTSKITNSDNKLDGGLQLLLNTLSTYLLQQYFEDNEIRDHIQLALKSKFFNVRIAVLEFIEKKGIKTNIEDLIWDLIVNEDFSYVLSRALRLYAKLCQDSTYSPDKINVLFSFLSNINESVRLSALECLGVCIREESSFSSEFLSLCTKLSHDSHPLDYRKSSNRAMVSYIGTGEKENLYSHCVLLVYERGLCDDDEEIRSLSTKCLSEICGRMTISDSLFMSQYLPTVVSSIIPEQYYSSAYFSMFMRNTLDQETLRVIVDKKKKFLLYAHEKDSLHKNELELIANICRFPLVLNKHQLNKMNEKVKADIEFVKELKVLYGNNYWMHDYVLYESEYRTNMNSKLLLQV